MSKSFQVIFGIHVVINSLSFQAVKETDANQRGYAGKKIYLAKELEKWIISFSQLKIYALYISVCVWPV